LIVETNQEVSKGIYKCIQCGEKVEIYNDGQKMRRCSKCKGTVFLRIGSINTPPLNP
jgi:DNA-directed RNA polymerase subunit RPC12/RpoP